MAVAVAVVAVDELEYTITLRNFYDFMRKDIKSSLFNRTKF